MDIVTGIVCSHGRILADRNKESITSIVRVPKSPKSKIFILAANSCLTLLTLYLIPRVDSCSRYLVHSSRLVWAFRNTRNIFFSRSKDDLPHIPNTP